MVLGLPNVSGCVALTPAESVRDAFALVRSKSGTCLGVYPLIVLDLKGFSEESRCLLVGVSYGTLPETVRDLCCPNDNSASFTSDGSIGSVNALTSFPFRSHANHT